MKVALFVGSLNGGGAERMMVNLANGFSKLGCTTTLICSSFFGPFCSEVSPSVHVVDLSRKNVMSSLFALVAVLRDIQPSFLLVTQSHSTLIAIIASKLWMKNIPLIVREATTPSQARLLKTSIKARVIDFLLKRCYKVADGFVAVSEGVREDVIKYYGIHPSKIHVINNPVITPHLLKIKDEVIKHPFLDPNRNHLTLIAVGRVTEVKDYGTLIRALDHVNAYRDAKLLVLGKYVPSSTEYIKLQTLISSLSLEDKVSFLGFISNPFVYMKNADVFVLSSIYEGMPGVLIQAMACGCQCVSTDCKSGPSEILEGGKLGELVPVGDPIGLGDAVMHIADSPVHPDLLQAKAEQFDYIHSSRTYLKYFKSLKRLK